MAVVSVNSGLYNNIYGGADPDPLVKAGRPKVASGRVANASTDSNLSTYRLIDLPSDCILDEGTWFYVANDGFADIRIGTLADPVALVSQLKSAGNLIQPIAAGAANFDYPLWQRLGLAADPGGWITLYKHAIANAVAAGSMTFRIKWIYR